MKARHLLFLNLIILPLRVIAGDSDTLFRYTRIQFGYAPSIFPPDWQKYPINAMGEPIAESEMKRSIRISMTALHKYPAEMLRLNIRSIYWLRKMEFYNVEYGGTNSNNAVYLTNDGENMGYSDNYLEQTFHHEFSSILLRNYPNLLDTVSWKAATDSSLDYNDPEDGVGAIRNNASSQDLDTLLCKKGMLTEYSRSSMENDVNTFAQNLFAPSDFFWKLVEQYTRIRQKTNLLISFYNKINPSFTEMYFRQQDKNPQYADKK